MEMSSTEKQIESMQESMISIIRESKEAIINKQYDIAFNILKQAEKEIEEDLIKKERVSL